jgi:hypothetical protein
VAGPQQGEQLPGAGQPAVPGVGGDARLRELDLVAALGVALPGLEGRVDPRRRLVSEFREPVPAQGIRAAHIVHADPPASEVPCTSATASGPIASKTRAQRAWNSSGGKSC